MCDYISYTFAENRFQEKKFNKNSRPQNMLKTNESDYFANLSDVAG
jgi:hypothetical protein